MKARSIPKSKAKNAYDLLSEVRALILEEPKRYDQNCWIDRRPGQDRPFCHKSPPCDTVGCIAGWIVTLKGPKQWNDDDTRAIANTIIGVDTGHFFDGTSVLGTPQTVVHARAGSARIRKFQREHKAALKAKAV